MITVDAAETLGYLRDLQQWMEDPAWTGGEDIIVPDPPPAPRRFRFVAHHFEHLATEGALDGLDLGNG